MVVVVVVVVVVVDMMKKILHRLAGWLCDAGQHYTERRRWVCNVKATYNQTSSLERASQMKSRTNWYSLYRGRKSQKSKPTHSNIIF